MPVVGISGRHALGVPRDQAPADVPYSQEPEADGLRFFPRNESSPAMEHTGHGRRSAGYNAGPPDQDTLTKQHGRRSADRPTDASPGGWRRAPRHAAAPAAALKFPPLPTGADLPTNTDALELAPLAGAATEAPAYARRKKTRTLTAALVTTGSIAVLVSSSSVAAGEPVQREVSRDTGQQDIITADPAAVLRHARVEVETTKAVVPHINIIRKADRVVLPTPSVMGITATKPAAPVIPAVPVAAPVNVAPVLLPGPRNGAIAAAALAQLGVFQDCTMLVTNSLMAAGISFHDWPAGYFSLGTIVTAAEAIPGDLAYYANGGTGVAHIAVYIGNGQAVHGGFNGNQTKIFSVNVGSGPIFIRVR